MQIIVPPDHHHGEMICMQYLFSIFWNTIERIETASNRARVHRDNLTICFEHDGIGQKVDSPDTVNMFVLEIGNDRIEICRAIDAIGRLEGMCRIGQPIRSQLYTEVEGHEA